jgi:hypothetical protein
MPFTCPVSAGNGIEAAIRSRFRAGEDSYSADRQRAAKAFIAISPTSILF